MTDSSFGSSAQRAARKEALCSGPQQGLAHKAPLQGETNPFSKLSSDSLKQWCRILQPHPQPLRRKESCCFVQWE